MNRSHSVAVPLFSFAKGVLVASVLPDFNLFPWLRREQILERARRKYRCFVRFPITIPGSDYTSQHPHCNQRNRRPNDIARLGDETTPPWLQYAVHFRDNAILLR